MTSPHVAQDDDLQQLEWIGGSTLTVLVDAAVSGGQLMVMRSELARGAAAPLHLHSREDEFMIMLDGAATFWVGDERHEVRAGGVAWMPRGLPHTYRIDSEQAHVLNICTPGGLEGFFRTAGRDTSLPRPDGWAITPQSIGAALAAHGGEVLGPPKGAGD